MGMSKDGVVRPNTENWKKVTKDKQHMKIPVRYCSEVPVNGLLSDHSNRIRMEGIAKMFWGIYWIY